MIIGSRVLVIQDNNENPGVYLGKHKLRELLVSNQLYLAPDEIFEEYSLGMDVTFRGEEAKVGRVRNYYTVLHNNGETEYYETCQNIYPEIDLDKLPELSTDTNPDQDLLIINNAKVDLKYLNDINLNSEAGVTLHNIVNREFENSLTETGQLKMNRDRGFYVLNTSVFKTILNNNIHSRTPVTVYKYANVNHSFDFPVMCSYSVNIAAKEWLNECLSKIGDDSISTETLLKIQIPRDFPCLSLSLPPWADSLEKSRISMQEINAQNTYGIVLPPCKFEILETHQINFGDYHEIRTIHVVQPNF
jgi:hypothetical protein